MDVTGVVDSSSTNSANTGLRSRGAQGSIDVLVTRGNSYKDTSLGQLGDGVVDSLILVGSQTEVGQDALRAVALVFVCNQEVNSLEDVGVGARAAISQDLDSEDETLLGNAVGLGRDGTRDMGTVAVTIRVLAVNE